MTGEHAPHADPADATRATPGADETAELIEQVRALAARDPDVRRAVTDVLAELDRVVGAAVRQRERH